MSLTASGSRFADFPTAFGGRVYRPGDTGYDEVKHLWNARGAGQLPALIAQATGPEDVRVAVDYARAQDVSIAVRGGGHGIECFAMPDGALVIDLSEMKKITVDAASGRTVVQAGAQLGELNAATEPHGFVVPAGTVSSVSVGGLTLGGGIGHLTRRFGASVDNLVAVEVVTMDGRILTASADENEELFWGLRGAGQNLAIATALTFQAQRVQGVVSRDWVFAPGDGFAALRALDEVMAQSPRELAITPLVEHVQPSHGLPEHLLGQVVVMATVTYTGATEDFESAMREARRLLPVPMMEMAGPTTWVELNHVIEGWMPAGRRWYNGGGYLSSIGEGFARAAIERVAVAPAGCEVHMPVMGGALHDFAEDSAVFSRKGANWMYEITAQWDDPADDAQYMAWVDGTQEALNPYTLPNGATNLTPVPYRGQAGLKVLYGSPEKWERLLKLKQTWDPDNRLRHNKNITPDD